MNILKLSPKDREAYEHYKENQRYQISLLEGSIWRAEEAEEKLAVEEAKRKEEEAKRKQLEAQLKQSLQNLIESGMDEAQAKRILGITP